MDKWQHFDISDMALFTGVQHLGLCTFNIVAPLFITFCQMFGRRRTPSARPTLLMFRIDCPIARIKVHRCGPGGSMRACRAAGPGSIPGRDKFPG